MPALTAANMAARAHRVSASEVAALMPEGHPYMTALDVYDRLSSSAPDIVAATLPMRIGSALESSILRLAADEFGLRVRANRHTYLHRSAPLCATPDAIVLNEDALVEIKYSGRSEMWATLPAYVYWQVQAQMACTNGSTRDRHYAPIKRTYVVVLVGTRLITFDVVRSRTAGRRICAAARRMEQRVIWQQPPPPPLVPVEYVDLEPSDLPLSMRMR